MCRFAPARVAVLIATLLAIAVAGRGQAPESAASMPRARAVSTRAAEMLSAAVPKYAANPVAAPAPAAAIPRVAPPEKPANQIVHLPGVIVRERRPPAREEILSDAELAKIGMNRYIGPYDGLDRGVLNLFTVKSLWKKIPVLGRYELLGFETNEERGLRLYKAAKQQEEFENLYGLLSIGKEEAAASGAGRTKKKK
jgi:hypothetical protein